MNVLTPGRSAGAQASTSYRPARSTPDHRGRPGGPGSSIRWRGELRVAPLPGPVDRATAPAGRIFYGRLLSGLLGR